MPRCPECRKFVSYGETNVEAVEVSIEGETLELGGTVALSCAECETDIAEAGLEASEDVSAHFDRVPDEGKGETVEYTLADDPVPQATERTEQKKTKAGKPAKSGEIVYVGAEAECTVRQVILDRDGEPVGEPDEATITIGDETPRSSFDVVAG
jgi:hypothetical protein